MVNLVVLVCTWVKKKDDIRPVYSSEKNTVDIGPVYTKLRNVVISPILFHLFYLSVNGI